MDFVMEEQELTCTDMVVYVESTLSALLSLTLEEMDPQQHLDVPCNTMEVEVPTPPPAIGNGGDNAPPPATAFTRANYRLYQGSVPGEGVHYRECQRNRDARVGGHAVDGCEEFVPGRSDFGTSLACGTCGCHRSYHRAEIVRGAVRILTFDPCSGLSVCLIEEPVV